jgi:hypothetical protein
VTSADHADHRAGTTDVPDAAGADHDDRAAIGYDTIGVGYGRVRRPDPRVERRIHDRLGAAGTVINLGAGTGSYEPTDRTVIAVEPSWEMIRQRSAMAAPVVRAGISGIARLPRPLVEAAMGRLAHDLATGRWQQEHADLIGRDEIDAGFRLVFTT